jgi:membrane fusion protein, heavy metal efflux system
MRRRNGGFSMTCRLDRLIAFYAPIIAVACAASLLSLGAHRTIAHEGHDHRSDLAANQDLPASPRVIATSEQYQLVGIVEGEVLVIYLDRAEDNAPVTTATIEVSINGDPFTAELDRKSGTYEAIAPVLRKAGSHEVLISLSEGSTQDLLVGTLRIPAANTNSDSEHRRLRQVIGEAIAAWPGGRGVVSLAGVFLLVAAAGGALLSGRRKLLIIPAALLGLLLVSAFAWAHEGHDHGPDLSASAANAPSRRPDGSIFVPKPTQRLLEIRTRTATVETRPRTVRFNGRVVADPNRSGLVQSTIQGRYQAPDGGVPALGTRVKAGDLLGRVEPSFASIDASDMAQTLGNVEQEIALARNKLARQEQLLKTNAVPMASVDDTRTQLQGLEKRRGELLAAKVRPEDLRAPVDGVIAATRVVAGQVVGQSDQLFQIVDPASLLVEALAFDQIGADAVEEALASIGGDAVFKLKFMGRSRALQQHYSLLQFRILEMPSPLDVGAAVAVVATTNARITGIILPSSAIAQAPNGQSIVFSHKEPEVFIPRAVRAEPFDSHNVLIIGGIAAGEKIVVQNAPLMNQVR